MVASIGARKMAWRKPSTRTATEAANQSQAIGRRVEERATELFYRENAGEVFGLGPELRFVGAANEMQVLRLRCAPLRMSTHGGPSYSALRMVSKRRIPAVV